MLTALARSGLDDDVYVAACESVRRLAASVDAADRLAESAVAADHYLPDSVAAAVGRYRLARLDVGAAARREALAST